MIHHPVIQGEEQWWKLRGGIPTASNFKRIVTPKGKISAQAEDYMNILLAEWIMGHAVENNKTEWMERGNELEDGAVRAYEFQRDIETEPGGFYTDDAGLVGASPDRLVGVDGLCEIKCPLAHTHVGYLLTGQVEDEYRPQLQGQLYVSGRKWVDIVSYHPEMPPTIIRVQRDEDYIKLLAAALGTFVELMLRRRTELEQRYGPFTRPEPPAEVDHSADFLNEEDLVGDLIRGGATVPQNRG